MKFKKLIAFVVSAVLIMAPAASYAADDTQQDAPEYLAYESIVNLIEKSYIDDSVTKDEIIKNAIANMIKDNPEALEELYRATFEGLDEYSQFYTPEEFQNLINGINNSFYGIGVVILEQGDYVTITECNDGGPADKAGIKPGDKITKVDGTDVAGWKIDDVRALIVGENGTDVVVTVLRDGQEIDYTVTRGEVKVDTVAYTLMEDNIGYIRISRFAEDTSTKFKSAIDYMNENNIANIILDLRDNPGGYLTSAIDIAKMIVPEGIIIDVKYRQEENNITYMSDLENSQYKFSVLVNDGTASAAEVLASALSDSGAGTLVGDTTFGKAVIQDVFYLPGGYGVKLTTGRYITRNGNEINKVGLSPDEITLNTKKQVDTSKYPKFDYKVKYNIGDTGESVQAAEERLDKLGYYVGDVDDTFTQETFDAVYNFQKDNGLYPYGVLDITTQVKINNVFYEMDVTVDNQLIKAYSLLGGDVSKLDID